MTRGPTSRWEAVVGAGRVNMGDEWGPPVYHTAGVKGDLITVVVGCLPPLLAGGVAGALTTDGRFQVIGAAAAAGIPFEREVDLMKPRVVVVGDQIDYEQTSRIRATSGAPRMVIVVAARGAGLFGPLLAANGIACIAEGAPSTELGTVVYLAATEPRMSFPLRGTGGQRECLAPEIAGLTSRELEVLRCLSRGLTNSEIAASLHIGTATVRTHVGRIFDKFGHRKRREYIGIPIP